MSQLQRVRGVPAALCQPEMQLVGVLSLSTSADDSKKVVMCKQSVIIRK